jgi:hypothetical protein
LESLTPASVVVLCDQFVEELASSRPDTNAVEVPHLKIVGGGPERGTVDENTMDTGSDRASVPTGHRCYREQ